MSRTNNVKPGALRIVVTGLIAQHPRLGGITWHYLQYVHGLALLGHDVYYVEGSGEGPYNLDGGRTGRDFVARDCSHNVAHLAEVASRFGFADRWAYHCPLDDQWYGLPDERRRSITRDADLLLNVSGALDEPALYRGISRLAYIDTDPVVTQIKFALRGDPGGRVDEHDIHFSFGESLGAPIPVTGHQWRATRQPVVLSEWEPLADRRDVYTTVMNWTSYEPLEYAGRSYGQKDVEFRRFLALPGAVGPVPLEVALGGRRHRTWETPGAEVSGIDDRSPGEILKEAGWQVVDAYQVGAGLDGYREYIRSSRAEWTVAKNVYVQGSPGWFSERSACYLAAGRPVVVQDTGFSSILPTGHGIMPFTDLASAAAAIASVEDDYSDHCEAARAAAESHFESGRVLTRLVEEAMNPG